MPLAAHARRAIALQRLPWMAACVVLCAGAAAAQAASDASADEPVAPAWSGSETAADPTESAPLPAPRLEVTRTELPRIAFTTQDISRMGASIGATNDARVDMTGWAWPHRQSGLGLSLGMELPQQRPGSDPRNLNGAGMNLGVRWRWDFDSGRRLDIATSRRMTTLPDAISLIESQQPALYRTRIEMQFVTGRSRITPEFGAIGMQLDSGARLSLRTKRGKPMLYYRSRF